jgi:hypothetical protein
MGDTDVADLHFAGGAVCASGGPEARPPVIELVEISPTVNSGITRLFNPVSTGNSLRDQGIS